MTFIVETIAPFDSVEAAMNVKPHHTPQELQTLYRTEMNAKLARRIHGVYLASRGMTCPQIMQVTGAKRRTVQQWVARYNRGGLEELKDKPRPGQPQHLPRHLEPQLTRRIEAGPGLAHPMASVCLARRLSSGSSNRSLVFCTPSVP